MTNNFDSIHRSIAHHAKHSTNALALSGVNGERFDYGALWKCVSTVGLGLQKRGFTSENCVAMVFPESPGTALAFLAISAVAKCAPLNPGYKERDFAFYLEDLKPRALVLPEGYETEAAAVAAAQGIPLIYVEEPSRDNPSHFAISGESGQSEREELPLPRGEAIAMILHTSGTTSRPKMVPLSHANLAVSAKNVATVVDLRPEDRALNVMPLFHIHGIVGGLLSTLYAGAAITCAPGFKGEHFIAWAKETKATWYSAVPTIHQAVLEQAKANPDAAAELKFRLIRSSSAALPPSVFREMEAAWKAPVIESYGMTEASHQMASNPLPPGQRKPGSVGVAAGPEVVVLNEKNEVLTTGEIGEIAIKGHNVTSGYVANPEANEKAYTDGWFRTGDEGRFDEDGYLYLTGRLKEMINRGGEKIAPKEIDEVLLEHEGVIQAVAFAVPHPTLGEDLAAALIRAPGCDISELEVRDFLSERVAGFKVPSRIVFVNEIPKGPTGKLQRIGLYARLQTYFESDFEAPVSEEEIAVAGAFASVLAAGEVSRNDNFFYLGGDSLKAQRALGLLQDDFSIEITPGTLFRFPTPALLGLKIAELRESESDLDDLAEELKDLSPEELEKLLGSFD